MPSPKRFGARSFGSLNVKKPPHALEDNELQTATNVDRSEAGVIKPAHNDLFQYSVQGIGNGLGVVTCSGVDYALYADDDYVWENGTSIGASGGDVTHRFLSDGYRRYVLNGVQNKVWDGANYRNHGVPASPTDGSFGLSGWVEIVTTDGDVAVSAATNANPVQLTVTGHGMSTGDHVYLSNFSGGTWNTIDDAVYAITRVDDDAFTINVNGTGLGSFSSGSARPSVLNQAGAYKWYAVYRYTMAGGQVLLSNPVQLPQVGYGFQPGDTTNYAAYTTTTSVQARYYTYEKTAASLASWIDDTGDVTVTVDIYRTKAGGDDLWLAVSSAADGAYGYDTAADAEMTAAWLDGLDSHTAPATASLGVFHQQRLFLASGANLYFSMVGKYDYFPPLNYITVVDQITALGKFGDSVVIFTPAGIKLYSPVGELGQLTDVQSSVGTTYPDSICHTGFGTLFCRKDGLWLFDGVSTTRISEPIDSLWKAASGTWRGAYVAGHGYFTCGDDASATALEFYRVGEDILWSTAPFGSTSAGYYWQSPYIALAADPGDDFMWGMSLDGYIAKLGGESTHRTATAKTKNFGDGTVRRWTRVYVDAETDTALTVTATTNRGQTTSLSVPSGTSAPKRFDLPINMIGEECNVQIVGTPTQLKGVWLDSV